MKLLSWFFPPTKCGICGSPLGESVGTIKYRVADRKKMLEMKICKGCGDSLENHALKPEDFK